jgi:hypothetical protein
MKCAIVLYGESFRDGKQHSRIRDTKRSVPLQIKASISHVNFAKFLKKHFNIDVDFMIHTYDTIYEGKLKQIYPNLTYTSSKQLLDKKTGNSVSKCAQLAIHNIKKDYDFIVLTRMDIYIKPHFYNIFNPYWNKIYMISQNNTKWKCGFYDNNIPIVNPTIQFIPKSYFNILKKINVDHFLIKSYQEQFNLTYDDFDFMVDDYHDADSNKDYNPYYKMISRPETKKWHDKGKKINRSLFGTKKKITC